MLCHIYKSGQRVNIESRGCRQTTWYSHTFIFNVIKLRSNFSWRQKLKAFFLCHSFVLSVYLHLIAFFAVSVSVEWMACILTSAVIFRCRKAKSSYVNHSSKSAVENGRWTEEGWSEWIWWDTCNLIQKYIYLYMRWACISNEIWNLFNL